MNEIELLEQFANMLIATGKRKASLYDGINCNRSVDEMLRFAVEELGEVSSAITRNRTQLAKDECLDLAHCAFLIYMALHK